MDLEENPPQEQEIKIKIETSKIVNTRKWSVHEARLSPFRKKKSEVHHGEVYMRHLSSTGRRYKKCAWQLKLR